MGWLLVPSKKGKISAFMTIQTIVSNRLCNVDINAIIKLQCLWRGYRVRRNFLSRNLYLLAKKEIDQCPNITAFPKAASGITHVYLSPTLPVVFKALGMQRNTNRFFTMWEAKDICIRSGYKHLLIPASHPYKEYNIEDKLPVHDVKQREQTALYDENHRKFTQAAREFTGFLCQGIFEDIVTDTHPYQREIKIPLGRCDNLPFLFNGDNGVVALIDLGGYEVRKEKLSLDQALECAKTAIYIFPHHFEEIFKEIVAFCPEASKARLHLQEICEQTLIRFKDIYQAHRQFIQQKMLSEAQLDSVQRIENVVQNIRRAMPTVNEETLTLLVRKIMLAISQKLNEITIIKQSDLYPTPLALVSEWDITHHVCQRFLSLKFNELSEIFKGECSESQIQVCLRMIFEELDGKEICYANQYVSRSDELLIRIHF